MRLNAFALLLTITWAVGSYAAGVAKMKLTSPQLKDGATIAADQVFNGMNCTGANISPELNWTGAPADTKTIAVTVFDPDAPTGSGWWHWVAFNIPAGTASLPSGVSGKSTLPAGTIESRTDYGKPGYGGPCPPPGKPHRYIFKVYALKDKIPLDKDAPAAMVGFYIGQLKLAEGSLEGKYGR